jgi:uncharacterized protein YjiS (DUF1127 family)
MIPDVAAGLSIRPNKHGGAHSEACPAAQPAARSARSIFHFLLVNWHSRRRLAKLRKTNDRLLRDIGLKREDVDWVLSRPLTGNAPDELRRILLRCTD